MPFYGSTKERTLVLERDNYTCQKCGLDISHGEAEVHHINDSADNSLDNLMSFCWICHPGERGEEFWKWLRDDTKNPRKELENKFYNNLLVQFKGDKEAIETALSNILKDF